MSFGDCPNSAPAATGRATGGAAPPTAVRGRARFRRRAAPQLGVEPRPDVVVERLLDDGGRENVGLPAALAILLDIALSTTVAGLDRDAFTQARAIEVGHLLARQSDADEVDDADAEVLQCLPPRPLQVEAGGIVIADEVDDGPSARCGQSDG